MKNNTIPRHLLVRSANHMSRWSKKVTDRFDTMMARLKGHKQKLREHQDMDDIDEDYKVEAKD